MSANTISMGAMCEPLSKQLARKLPHERLQAFDRMADAVTLCVVQGLIGDSVATVARKRILDRIKKEYAFIRATPPAVTKEPQP